MERRLAAILAADVVGYSRRMGESETATLKALRECRAILGDLVVAEKGRIINTAGDSVLAEFQSVIGAVRCATTFQSRMDDRNSYCKPIDRLEFRVGINQGELVAGALAVECVLDDCIDESLLGREGSKDGAFRDARSLGDLPGTHLAAEPLQQRLGCRDERSTTLIQWQGGGSSHAPSIVSEHSLSKGLSRRVILFVTIVAMSNDKERHGGLGPADR